MGQSLAYGRELLETYASHALLEAFPTHSGDAYPDRKLVDMLESTVGHDDDFGLSTSFDFRLWRFGGDGVGDAVGSQRVRRHYYYARAQA
nr:hypothetical protein CFP56_01157 [Quercus suber]